MTDATIVETRVVPDGMTVGIESPEMEAPVEDIDESSSVDYGPVDPLAVACSKFSETDTGNAKRLALRMRGWYRYVGAWKSWIHFDGRRWIKDTTNAVLRAAVDAGSRIVLEVSVVKGPQKQKDRLRHAHNSQDERRIQASVRLVAAEKDLHATPDEFDCHPYLFNVQNGTLDLKDLTGAADISKLTLHRPDPAHFITKLAAVTFDPKASCPAFLKFVNDVQPDPEICRFLQKAFGYAITGAVSEHCMVFMLGNGRNGKGTLMNTFLKLMGDYGREADPNLLLVKQYDSSGLHGVADLFGARYVTASEPAEGKRFDEAMIKRITGGDRRKGERKYENMFEYEATDKIFLAANHKPDIKGTDEGIWSRFRLVPFDRFLTPAERDKDLPEKLAAEMSGILNWALEGCRLWMEEGLAPAPAMEAQLAEYRTETDLAGRFIAEKCVLHLNAKITSGDLYKVYSCWAELNHERPLSSRGFSDALKRRRFEPPVKSTNGHMFWHGIGLLANGPVDYSSPEDKEFKMEESVNTAAAVTCDEVADEADRPL